MTGINVKDRLKGKNKKIKRHCIASGISDESW